MSTPTNTTLAPGLARKVKKILEIKTESADLINSLSTLSSFYNDNDPPARRALRTTIERRGLDINQKFLTAAEAVIQALDDVQGNLDGLASSCGHISATLAASRAASAPLLADTDKLGRELGAVEQRAAMVKDFLEQYQLAPEEVAALQGQEVGPAFFGALARVRQIHDNCKALLRTHHQRAGLELMDLMASHQEGAYERLCRWVQNECRSIGEFDAPEVDPTLQTAVRALSERPVLFKYCAEEVATARHNALFQRFITALTRGGPGGLPRPIEIHAHDPQRYVSDMLAWVHQALASEREFVVALFGEAAASTGGGSTMGDTGHAGGDASATLLDRIFESICRPLKVRVEQVLMMSPPLLLCYQLAHLLAFYHELVAGILGTGAQLSATLRGCRDMAQRSFLEQLRAQGDRLLRNPPPPPADLAPPQQVADALHQLQQIMAAHSSALQGDAAQRADGAGDFSSVLAAVIDPLVEACERSAEALSTDVPTRVDEVSKLDPSAHRVYLINCLAAMQASLAGRTFTAPRVKQLNDMLEAHMAALVGGQVGRLLARCTLAEVAERMRLHLAQGREQGALAADPALALPTVLEAMRAFFVLVSSPDALPEFTRLQVARLRAEAVSRVARSLVDTYELVYSALDDPCSGYQELGGASVVKHSPVQVRTILGVI